MRRRVSAVEVVFLGGRVRDPALDLLLRHSSVGVAMGDPQQKPVPHHDRRRNELRTQPRSSVHIMIIGGSIHAVNPEASCIVEPEATIEDSPSGFTVSSGRREHPGRGGCLVVGAVIVIISLISVFELTRREDPPPIAAPAPVPTAPATPVPQPATTPTPESFSSEVIVKAPTLTPTPWIPSASARPERRPSTPTPSSAACVTATWNAQQTLAARATILVNISATNRCRRVLQPTDVWFRVTGHRNGDLIQTAQGSPFSEIYPGRTTHFGIGLPGSIDWYDEIRVEVFD